LELVVDIKANAVVSAAGEQTEHLPGLDAFAQVDSQVIDRFILEQGRVAIGDASVVSLVFATISLKLTFQAGGQGVSPRWLGPPIIQPSPEEGPDERHGSEGESVSKVAKSTVHRSLQTVVEGQLRVQERAGLQLGDGLSGSKFQVWGCGLAWVRAKIGRSQPARIFGLRSLDEVYDLSPSKRAG
jgi:hypothetical protein